MRENDITSSIEKWEFIGKALERIGNIAGAACGLCLAIDKRTTHFFDCENCPLYKLTGIKCPNENSLLDNFQNALENTNKKADSMLNALKKLGRAAGAKP